MGRWDSTATPKRDAVVAWLGGDRRGPIQWPEERWPDPPEWADPAVRAEAVVRCLLRRRHRAST